LEDGLNPNALHHALPNPDQPSKAVVYVGRLRVRDTTPPGDYNFKRALKLSSNSYFIHAALRTGPEKIVELGQQLHLGERTGIMPMQEAPGAFPTRERVTRRWTEGNTANLAIGQDPVLMTPVQVAVLTAAIANGGKVLRPRLAQRLEPQDSSGNMSPMNLPPQPPRGNLGVKAANLGILREAMLADVEEPDGTGRRAAVPGLRICGKTGTAQNENVHGHKIGQTTWFASFAPYEKPKYAVVVVVEDGASGGETCAPIAGKIYSAILASERKPANVAAFAPR
jgi:penicillin-binding protein 2